MRMHGMDNFKILNHNFKKKKLLVQKLIFGQELN